MTQLRGGWSLASARNADAGIPAQINAIGSLSAQFSSQRNR